MSSAHRPASSSFRFPNHGVLLDRLKKAVWEMSMDAGFRSTNGTQTNKKKIVTLKNE